MTIGDLVFHMPRTALCPWCKQFAARREKERKDLNGKVNKDSRWFCGNEACKVKGVMMWIEGEGWRWRGAKFV